MSPSRSTSNGSAPPAMGGKPVPSTPDRFHRLAERSVISLSLVVFLLGAAGLGGWVFENDFLKSFGPGWITMKVTTAVALMICALALYFSVPGDKPGRARGVAMILGAIAACFGLMVIAEYTFNLDLGFDKLFFRYATESDLAVRGRPAPSTVLNFVLLGSAFLIINSRSFTRYLQVAKALGFTVFGVGLIAIAGYLCVIFLGKSSWIYTGMAFHTAVSFVMLGSGVVILAVIEDGVRWSVDLQTTLVFFSGLGLMLFAAEMTYVHTKHLYHASTLLTHREEVLKELQEAEKGISNLQGSQRDYLITGDESLLLGRDKAIDTLWSDLAQVRSLTKDNALQQEGLLRATFLVARWLSAEEAAIAIRRTYGLEESVELLKDGISTGYRREIEEVLDSMAAEENRLRIIDSSVMRSAASDTFLLLPVEAFLGAGIFLVALFSLDAELRRRNQAERDLRGALKNETDLRNAIDEHAILAVTNSQGLIEFVNDKFCRITGYSREELIGQDHRIVNSGYHPQEFFENLWATIRSGKVWKGDIKNRAKDGTCYWVNTTIVPFLGDDGKPTHFVGIRTDITPLKATEESLRESEASLARERTLLHTLVETIPDLIFIKDQNYAFVYCNKAFEDFFEVTSDQLRGLKDADIYSPENAAMARKLETRVLETLQFQRSEKTITSPSGRSRDVEVLRAPLFDAEGRCAGLVGISRDITERRSSEAQVRTLLERLRIALQASGAGIWELDLASDEAVWDEQMYTLYGMSAESAEKGVERWYRCMSPEDILRCKQTIDAVRKIGNDIFELDFQISRADNGERRFIRANGIVKRDAADEIVRIVGSNRDVTEEKQREQELADALAMQKKLAASAKEGERAKGQFLATMSHELRTPMNGILGFIQLLGESHGLSPAERDYTNIIRKSAEALLRILDDVLDFSRMDAGRVEIECKAFAPRQLVLDIHRLMAKQAADRGLVFDVRVADTVSEILQGDPGRIRQILLNLIGNAIKFTSKGGVVLEVTPSPAENFPATDDGRIWLDFIVQDTGIGISREKLALLFQPFVQGDSSISRRFGGTGLGLAISQKLAEYMDGAIHVQSEEGKGSRFIARLPLKPASEETFEAEPLEEEALDESFAKRHPLRVLVVEDDRVNLKLIQALLWRLGYESAAAENGKDAIALYHTEHPDCILTDLQMPVMDGLELTRAIRAIEKANGGAQKVSVVAVTANILPADHRLCVEAGMDDYLNKPIKVASLAAVLAAASRHWTSGG